MSDSFDVIYRDLHITSFDNKLTEEYFLNLISGKVMSYLENDMDLLLSYLYRLDVEEKDITRVLQHGNPDAPHLALAKLILARQKQRMLTKKNFKVESIDDPDF